MRNPWSSWRSGSTRDSRGQSMVEFAFVAPFLFLLIFGMIEAGRFVFYSELLNSATREGARYGIVHGSKSDCPSGPAAPGETNGCDPSGANVRQAVQDAAMDLASVGDLFVFDPTWTSRGSLSVPSPGDASNGHNGRGEYVTVFVDFVYDPIIKQIMDVPLIPELTISAQSTLVVNN